MGELDKIRWHCRRGLLELDLILERFNERHLASLSPDQVERFAELLAFPDNDLLDFVLARAAPPGPRYDRLLRLLRAG